ncbi:MAG: hypothetical protein M0036_24530 [Desulfobacteraceae bacterium]|nr:hypothetical protein [Desulfobacteraceae bacterium]
MKEMKKLFLLLPLAFLIVACGSSETPTEFQQNRPVGFQLTNVTKGYGAVDSGYNSVDAHEFNNGLAAAVDGSQGEFKLAQYATASILAEPQAPVAELVRADSAGLLSRLIDPRSWHYEKTGVDSFYPLSGEAYNKDFYAFLDRMSGDGYKPPSDYISGMAYKVAQQTFERLQRNNVILQRSSDDKRWLNTKVADIVEDLQDPIFQEDFTIATKVMNKLLLQADYPEYLGTDNLPCNYGDIFSGSSRCASVSKLDLGNAAQGTQDLITWFNRLIQNSETRRQIHDMILGFDSVLDPAPEAQLALKTRTLMENLRDNFTTNGTSYNANPVYNENSSARYSDAELSQTIREASTSIQQLFVRSDRPQSMIVTQSGQTPIYPLDLMNANLRSIGFNPDTIEVDRSLDDMIRYDVWGRDRLTDPAAWPGSFLESLLFLTEITSNFGWKDGGASSEYSAGLPTSRIGNHGHGTYTEELTLNDSLFSINMIALGSSAISIWNLTLPNPAAFTGSGLMSSTAGNNIYRTKTPFTLGDVNQLYTGTVASNNKDYRFFYNQNYGVLQMLAGPGVGDLGTPDGGNPTGNPSGATPDQLMNQYRAYAPNGLHETQLSAWTMGWVVRTCFHGEGPYYYADPNAEIVAANGQSYHKYLRPDGKVYALVSMDGSQYLYPTDNGDVQDPETAVLSYNSQPQRANRYKSQWHSDYYMIHFPDPAAGSQRYVTLDNSSGTTQAVEIQSTDLTHAAGALTFQETVAENDPMRACASPEEAFFRNYQWTVNEKKMVIVIPLYLDQYGLGTIAAGAFQVLEANGWSGLSDMRKLGTGTNHVWAKKGGTDPSNIPGDYRIEVVSVFSSLQGMDALLGPNAIYNNNLDCGNATPSIVGHNLPALTRLAFPRSTDPQGTFVDNLLGSEEFEVGDANWQKRNAIAPILFSLMAGLRDYSPAYDANQRPGIGSGMRAFLNQTAIWIKPLFYYNRTSSAPGPSNTWIPRVYGIFDTNGDGVDDRPSQYYQGFQYLTSSADFYNGTPTTWFGSWAERRFYQPVPIKTILNVLVDSDLTNPQTRYNGLLPMLTASSSKPLGRFFKLFLNPAVSAPPLEQIFTAMKFSKGPLTAINADPASGKGMVFPGWMFLKNDSGQVVARNEDIDLDEILDKAIYDDLFGLARDRTEEDWSNFSDNVLTVADLLNEDSPYCISQNALDLMDRIFARKDLYTSDEIKGFLYNMGKLFGYYDAAQGRWVYQGESQFADMYNMLALRVPDMNTLVTKDEVDVTAAGSTTSGKSGFGDHYYAQLTFLREASAAGGLVEYIQNTMSCPQNWETTLADLNRFIGTCPDVAGANARLWPTVAQLLQDMGDAVESTQGHDAVGDIMKEYGFQVNR